MAGPAVGVLYRTHDAAGLHAEVQNACLKAMARADGMRGVAVLRCWRWRGGRRLDGDGETVRAGSDFRAVTLA